MFIDEIHLSTIFIEILNFHDNSFAFHSPEKLEIKIKDASHVTR